MQILNHGGEADCPMATWADGHTAIISDITNLQLRAVRTSRKPAPASDRVLELEHAVSHHRISCKMRPDRTLLCSVFEQAKQVCQVHVMSFATPDSDAPENEEAQEKAFTFMCDLARDYANDKLPLADLYKERDTRLKALGVATRLPAKNPACKRPACKRPAAADAAIVEPTNVNESESETGEPKAKKAKATKAMEPKSGATNTLHLLEGEPKKPKKKASDKAKLQEQASSPAGPTSSSSRTETPGPGMTFEEEIEIALAMSKAL